MSQLNRVYYVTHLNINDKQFEEKDADISYVQLIHVNLSSEEKNAEGSQMSQPFFDLLL
jgi:hypothetical protein